MKTRKKSRPGPSTSNAGVNGTREAMSTRQRSSRPAKPATAKPRRQQVFTLKQERSQGYRALCFPEAKGKTTARVELVTSDEYHAVVVVFEDNTAVGFEFQPCFTVQAFGDDIEAVGCSGQKTWPKVLSEG